MRLLFTCFLFSSLAAFSQTKLPVLIPASPEVSSLLNDVSFSSSLYTGAAQTSFNFHTLKLGTFQMPITAEYFTNGIRVDDIPSRIGLGWNLNAGGYVSRVVRDEPDGSSTFLNPPANLWQGLSPLNDWTDFLIQFRTLNLGNHEYKTSKLECLTEASTHPGSGSVWDY